MTKPIIILVAPQLGENIGAAARAMANFDYEELRIVNPRDGWPNTKAEEMSAGGINIIRSAEIFDSLDDAFADINYLIATSARRRDMEKKTSTPKDCIDNLGNYEKLGILFGRERSGLTNEEVVLADEIITIPVSKNYPSINISQAVGIVCYEFYCKYGDFAGTELSDRAPKEELINFFRQLEEKLDNGNFFKVEEKKQKMINNIRNIFSKADLTEQEIKTLHGIITSLSGK